MKLRYAAALLIGLLAFAMNGVAPAFAAPPGTMGSAQVKYRVLPLVKLTVVPNYQSGFGPQGGTGSGATPAPGALAVLDSGTVDFGNLIAGFQYLYKYAALVTVQTNDTAGFIVYAEGSTDLNGSNPVPSPPTFPINQALFWMVSSTGNSPFSAATPFNSTTSPVSNGGQTITYAVGPPASSQIWSNPTGGTVTQGYDYQLRLPTSITPAANSTQFNVYVVYTVVGN
jgi:hypothetical protein